MVIGIIGRMGSGKTLNMTKWGLLFSELTKKRPYFNYHVKGGIFFKNYHDITHVHHAIICYDEISTEHDSRNYEAKGQIKFTHWFLQNRKRGNDFLYTTQRFNTVEKRIRENTDILILCKEKGRIERIIDIQDGEDRATELATLINEKTELYWHKYDTNEIIDPTTYN